VAVWQVQHAGARQHSLGIRTDGPARQQQGVYCIGPQAQRVGEFIAQQLANTARAFALMGHVMGQLNNQLFAALAQKQSYGSASAARRGSPTQPGPFALLGQLANKLFTALALQRICRWAISSHGGPPTQSGHSQRWARSTTMFDCIGSLLAVAGWQVQRTGARQHSLGIRSNGPARQRSVYGIGSQAKLRFGEFNVQELTNTAWVFSLIGRLDNKLFSLYWLTREVTDWRVQCTKAHQHSLGIHNSGPARQRAAYFVRSRHAAEGRRVQRTGARQHSLGIRTVRPASHQAVYCIFWLTSKAADWRV